MHQNCVNFHQLTHDEFSQREPKAPHCLRYINGTETVIFRDTYVNTVTADAMLPSVASSTTTIIQPSAVITRSNITR